MTDNVRVHETGRPAPSSRVLGLVTAVVLVVGSCSGEEEPSAAKVTPAESASPSSTVEVAPGARLTEAGTELSFGETATVIYEPGPKRGTVLELTAKKVRQGSTRDLSRFILDRYTRSATPYYVDVDVVNVGAGRVGGSAVPLWGVDGRNRLLPPATFTVAFPRCPSEPLPARFGPGRELKTCLVFLAPDKGTMEAVSFRPDQAFDPIRWTGEVEPRRRP